MKMFRNNKGSTIMQTLFVILVGTLLIAGFASFAAYNVKASRYQEKRELALQLAEAGANYYRWHLAHAEKDFKDGTTTTGPYVHNFTDKNGVILGTFSLAITPAATGSTVVIVKSTGNPANEPNIKRTVKFTLAKPSLAQYAVVSDVKDDGIRFGEGTEVFGPIHANGGIRFDGLAHGIISSATTSYNDPDHTGANEFGVHTHKTTIDPLPPNSVPNRTDVFMVGRKFPVPVIDFSGITSDLRDIQKLANSTSGDYYANSGALGYHIVLKTNNTYDIYTVTRLQSLSGGCENELDQDGWGSWSIRSNNGQTLINNYPYPENGLIFVEDNLWIDGQINNNRLTIVSARLPDTTSTRTSVSINENLKYTYYDGKDVLGIIAQKNINIGTYSANDLRIDAALLAQWGRIGRYYYGSGCGNHNKHSITTYGMIGTYRRYGFGYTDGTGYANRYLYYDSNLLYSPPPEFPPVAEYYQLISWEEVPNP